MRERSPRVRLFDSFLLTLSAMAGFGFWFAVCSALIPVPYSAEEVQVYGVAYLMGSAGVFLLIHSIGEAVETHREMRAEARERPERERKIEEARLAAEAEAAAHRGERDV